MRFLVYVFFAQITTSGILFFVLLAFTLMLQEDALYGDVHESARHAGRVGSGKKF